MQAAFMINQSMQSRVECTVLGTNQNVINIIDWLSSKSFLDSGCRIDHNFLALRIKFGRIGSLVSNDLCWKWGKCGNVDKENNKLISTNFAGRTRIDPSGNARICRTFALLAFTWIDAVVNNLLRFFKFLDWSCPYKLLTIEKIKLFHLISVWFCFILF